MKIIKPAFLLIFILCSMVTFGQIALPKQYKTYLDKNYNGWTYSTLAKYCAQGGKGKSASIIRFDFNKDDQLDYVVKIKTKTTGHILVFFSIQNKYKVHEVDEDSADKIEDCKIELYKGKLYVNWCETSSYFCTYNGSTLEKHWLTD